jgi:hypothetical protein
MKQEGKGFYQNHSHVISYGKATTTTRQQGCNTKVVYTKVLN